MRELLLGPSGLTVYLMTLTNHCAPPEETEAICYDTRATVKACDTQDKLMEDLFEVVPILHQKIGTEMTSDQSSLYTE